MGRSPCCSKEGMNRGAWTAQEDKILTEYIRIHGEGKWRNLPKRAGLKRCGKSCRLRWLNYLRPDIKRGNISPDEEELIIRLHKLLGNRWSLIAGRLPGRTDNEIKNYWNTNLGKKVQDQQSPAQTPKLSRHSNENNLKMSSKTNMSLNKVSTISTSKMASHVIRTKAIRCSKVFLTPQPSQHEHFINTNELRAGQILDGQLSINKAVESDTYGEFFSFASGGEDNMNDPNSLDFMTNFNMGEICLTDLLSSDFSDMCDIINYSNDARNDLSPSSEQQQQQLMLSEEMLQDWSGSNCLQPNVASNLQSLASILDSGDEWLGQ